ncbi:MAG: O-methyltransferase [Evtepia sp.]|jgi:tRNA1(Val) A37 N6-methylase TrmN6|nr:O-methyltransferase [Evtepia sp.]
MKQGESREYLERYTLLQSEDCFKLGRDSILLSHFASVKPGIKVCDLGCGIGSLLLLLSQRVETLVRCGIELDPVAADLARRNLAENGLSGEIVTGDLRMRELLPPDSFQLVISNPPYFRQGTGKSGGSTRMEEQCSIEELCTAAGRLLRTGGRFAVVFRPERLPELFSAMQQARIEPKRMQVLSYNREKPPYAILAEGVKEGGAGLSVLPVHYQEEG